MRGEARARGWRYGLIATPAQKPVHVDVPSQLGVAMTVRADNRLAGQTIDPGEAFSPITSCQKLS